MGWVRAAVGAALGLAVCSLALGAPAKHVLSYDASGFQLDGKPFQIRAGEIHFARIPRAYWRDRLRKLKAMGLNAVGTYVFWNWQEPEPGKYDWSGRHDVAEFIREAQEEGLWVLLRPGPYSCAEWEWGGFPYWLANIPGMQVRSDNEPFLKAVRAYFHQLGKQLSPLMASRGGPILLTQVENEYGSYGHDKAYSKAIQSILRESGFDGVLYTADGPSDGMLGGGTLPGVLPVVNFGGNGEGPFEELEKFRPGSPKMCGEYYPGWFDHWGEEHNSTSTEDKAKDIGWMMGQGDSFSIYVFDGGTNFGFMNGSNYSDHLQPTTTSYDYSTTLDEAGNPTSKYFAIRDAIYSGLGLKAPAIPAGPKLVDVPRFGMAECGRLFQELPGAVRAETPETFEQLGQAYGFVLYRTTASGSGELKIDGLRDRAIVYANGAEIGTLDYRLHQDTLEVDLAPATRLDVLVENLGRVNYGGRIVDQRKGILGSVSLGGRELTGWEMYRLPLSATLGASTLTGGGPAVYRGSFSMEQVGDTFLDMSGWGKGAIWVNGHNLGRFWSLGPQQCLYLPGCWLHPGRNEVVAMELYPGGARSIQGVTKPVYALRER